MAPTAKRGIASTLTWLGDPPAQMARETPRERIWHRTGSEHWICRAVSVAALGMVRVARSQSRVAREALEADTQPLLTDAPRGVFLEQVDWHEASGEITRRTKDKAEIGVGTFGNTGGEPIAFASVPVRNVGNGCARVGRVTFLLGDGSQATGRVDNPVLPSGELTHARLDAGPEDDGVRVAESVGMDTQDFAIVLDYADVASRPRGAVRLDVANGEYPHITGPTPWGASIAELR